MEANLCARMSKLLLDNDDDFSDCTFVVETKEIKAHRAVLAAASPVFRIMLRKPWGGPGIIVTIEDITHDVFMDVLKFCYTDALCICAVERAGLLLYAFNKYMIKGASDKCKRIICDQVSMDNAVDIYRMMDGLLEQDVSCTILFYICQYAFIILDIDLDKVDGSLLKNILLKQSINMKETKLIAYAYRWAKNTILNETGIIPCDQDIRNLWIANDILPAIRFFSLTSAEYNEVVDILTGVLTCDELSLINNIVSAGNVKEIKENTLNLCNITIPRMSIPWKVLSILRPFGQQMPSLVVNEHSIITAKVKSEKTILLQSITIPTRMLEVNKNLSMDPRRITYTEKISITITKCSGRTRDPYIGSIQENVPYQEMQNVTLDTWYLLRADEWYEFVFRFDDLDRTVHYKADRRGPNTNADSSIEYEDEPDDESYGPRHSFLVGLKYNV